jgi:hydroxyacylglutathione hydrolase
MRKHYLFPTLFVALLGLGAYRTLGPRTAADLALLQGHSLETLASQFPPAEPGTFPATWIHGGDCANDPEIQIHAYNSNFYIFRQSKCETVEAPFLFLMFGDDKALLMDTGALPDAPVWKNVSRVVRAWLQANGKTSIELIVAHTHSHADHVQGDSQFVGKPFVSTIVGTDLTSVKDFWDLPGYPLDSSTIDLGNRVIDVLGTPGHNPNSITLYDRRTQLLLTGDLVYPGHLFVFNPDHWPDFKASVRRLVEFAAVNPVEWVVGCHVEMSATPGVPFMYTTPFQPNEHPLELSPNVLLQLHAAAAAMGNQAQCLVLDELVIHPVYDCGIFWNG